MPLDWLKSSAHEWQGFFDARDDPEPEKLRWVFGEGVPDWLARC